MTEYILLALIVINCVLIIINWRLHKKLKRMYQYLRDEEDAIYVRGINVGPDILREEPPLWSGGDWR